MAFQYLTNTPLAQAQQEYLDKLISQCMGHTSIRTTQIYLSRISSRKVDTAVDGMYDRMLRKPKHKRKERDIPSGCHRKSESPVSQPMENGNTHPHVSQTPENEKCPFLSKKETFVSCHVNTVIFFAAKVYISYICSKFSSAFFLFHLIFLPAFPPSILSMRCETHFQPPVSQNYISLFPVMSLSC